MIIKIISIVVFSFSCSVLAETKASNSGMVLRDDRRFAQIANTTVREAAVLLTEILADQGITLVVNSDPEILDQTLTGTIGKKNFDHILKSLFGDNDISYAFFPNLRVDSVNEYDYRLVLLGSPGQDARNTIEFQKAKEAQKELKSLAKIDHYSASKDDASYILAMLRDRFTSSDQEEKREALNLAENLYNDWALREAQAFIEEVARGSMSFQVEQSVRRHATNIINAIDD